MSRTPRGTRSWGQRLVLALSGGLALSLLVTAGGIGYAYSKYSRLARVELGAVLTERTVSTAAQNFLLVGVDSAESLSDDDPAKQGRDDVNGLRSDTMMILRVDPSADHASLLSLPRDLWVPLASGGINRLNAAIQSGGPEVLIDTIEEYLGIPINHYVQVDFGGFRDLVDVIDGVKVWFEHPVRDRRSGLEIEQPGCLMLDPDQALAYVRSRHFETFEDGRWRTDPTGDLGRISRQQDFIVRALDRAIDRGVRNPVTLDRLVDAALETVTVDDVLTGADLVDLGSQFRSFDPAQLDMHALPVTDATIGGAAVLRLRDVEAQPILDLFRGTDTASAEVTPAGVRVQVLNGTGVSGQAGEVSSALAAVGFTAAGTGEADSFTFDRTVVRYQAGQGAAADLVARYLTTGATLEQVSEPTGADVVVITGADYAGVELEPAAATSSTSTSTVPGTTTTAAATSPSSSTSTTVIGEVPQPPPDSGC
jgi:LCP family protein required for cell wall assembly